jgi:hypothetical protein
VHAIFAFMENLPKKGRGRPRKLPKPPHADLRLKMAEIPTFLRESMGFNIPSDRTAANRHYAELARDTIEGLSESLSLPEEPVRAAKLRVGMDWILGRTTVLSELGRLIVDQPTKRDVARFQGAVLHIAERHDRMSATGAAAYARRVRLGETRRRTRIAALHHDLNTAINEHRQRYPETTWADVEKALGHTVQQIARKTGR